jgi:hypothetical protein
MSEWKVARARRWQDFGSITIAQRMVRKRVRGRLLFIPQEAKRRHLDEVQVSKQEQESKSQEGGAPLRV